MRAVVQRVSSASVTVAGRVVGEIAHGLLALVGVEPDDGAADVDYIAGKTSQLRVFDDDQHHMNRSVLDVEGGVLVVSQFTLAADCRKGRRPSFDGAASPPVARPLYEQVVRAIEARGLRVATGGVQASMQVSLVNDGAVPLALGSRKRFCEEPLVRRLRSLPTIPVRACRVVVFVIAVVASPPAAFAQQRPLVTEDPEPIGAGRILIEGGIDYAHDY